MEVNFKYNAPGPNDPIVFEEIFAEKPGGGIVGNPSYDVPVGTAVGEDADGKLVPVKAYRVTEDAEANATEIKVAKGSGAAVGDVVSDGSHAAAVTAVDQTAEGYDKLTVSLSLSAAVSAGDVLGQAASADDAGGPAVKPLFLTGGIVYAGEGDQAVRLVNGANVRRGVVPAADWVIALMKNIEKV